MSFRKRHERPLKMVWQARKDERTSFLVGTAHFFPYSFRWSLTDLFQRVTTVLMEGPLDQESMAKVVRAGHSERTGYHVFQELGSRTVDLISKALSPVSRSTDSLRMLSLFGGELESPVYAMVKGMKPWLAFFTLFSRWLAKYGWKFSVDQEAYGLAQETAKKVIFLETIEEQIDVLDRISQDRILDFLRRFDHWPAYTSQYVEWYLNAELELIKGNPYGFPTRNQIVIDDRDEILFQRALPYFDKGEAVACVGAPHVVVMAGRFRSDGYLVTKFND